MQRLRKEHPTLCEGWAIIKKESISALVKKGHDLSVERLKKKMEQLIEKEVRKSLLEYERQEDEKENPFANRKTMKGEVRDSLEERKRKLIQNDEWETKLEERKRKLIHNEHSKDLFGYFKKKDEMKLRNSLGKLAKAKDKLELLLVEADKETIKENIPEAPRAKCLEAWAKAGKICLRIKHAISQKTRQNF